MFSYKSSRLKLAFRLSFHYQKVDNETLFLLQSKRYRLPQKAYQ